MARSRRLSWRCRRFDSWVFEFEMSDERIEVTLAASIERAGAASM